MAKWHCSITRQHVWWGENFRPELTLTSFLVARSCAQDLVLLGCADGNVRVMFIPPGDAVRILSKVSASNASSLSSMEMFPCVSHLSTVSWYSLLSCWPSPTIFACVTCVCDASLGDTDVLSRPVACQLKNSPSGGLSR